MFSQGSRTHQRRLFTLLAVQASLLCASGQSFAETSLLPYKKRTLGYSGWSSTIRGDIRTLGMAGAMVGIGDTFIASGYNPAGVAMTNRSLSLQITGNAIHDGEVQRYDQTLTSYNLGLAASLYPWGLSVGYWSPQNEGQMYRFEEDGERFYPDFRTREYRVSLSRLFFEDRLSFGVSALLAQADKRVEFPDSPESGTSHHGYAPGVHLGLMYRLPRNLLLGLTYSNPIDIRSDSSTNPSPMLQGFFQTVKIPYRLGAGVGWVPNPFFRAGLDFYLIGKTHDVALLSDETRKVGQEVTIQPRLGFSYTLFETKRLMLEIAGGTYYEMSRILGAPHRWHATGGLQLSGWLLNFGWGIDNAPNYVNYIYSFGIDVVRTMRKLDLIPQDRSISGGFMPSPWKVSETGLSRPLCAATATTEAPANESADILKIGQELPEKLVDRVINAPQGITDLGGDFLNEFGTMHEHIAEEIEKRRIDDKKQAQDRLNKP